MPKVVDPDQRRAQILDAAHRLVDTRGLDGLSFRNVAAESSLNIGSIRHTYPTQHDLLADAAVHVGRQMDERLTRHDLSGEPGTHTVSSAIDALAELLPLDDVRRRENVVLGEFMLASRTRAVFREITDEMSRSMETVVARVLAGLDVPADELARRAATVKSLMVGMTFDVTTGHGDLHPDEMTNILTDTLHDMIDGASS
ncbi:TetR/AcrR family transcriptional regulator [Corynebacterium glyciniphilum]|uniref:TetR/AcrR family transcriptional regulator n=1 Tax=Corynebacterium glyciniphilum TaxID=1404244 RepID=UPI0026529DE8|nr:TetR/AcrR family transcriptional regulator [Corynebacterium glyciniphilum]MDN5683033.1 TetR/AcrR family transcriptional regulator [Corynebacterium glyciniphilum]